MLDKSIEAEEMSSLHRELTMYRYIQWRLITEAPCWDVNLKQMRFPHKSNKSIEIQPIDRLHSSSRSRSRSIAKVAPASLSPSGSDNLVQAHPAFVVAVHHITQGKKNVSSRRCVLSYVLKCLI